MPIEFKIATLENSFVRMALAGPQGSGKTLTALKLARWLGSKTVVIDTENDTAKLFAKHPDTPKPYLIYNLNRFEPQAYCQVIDAVAQSDFDVCIIDSLSHSWNGTGGILEIAGGDIRGWKAANPEYQKLIKKVMSFNRRMHMIVTLRAKQEYALEKDETTGRMTVVKHGIEPIHRSEFVYEPDIIGMLDQNNVIRFDGVGKTRCPELRGKTFADPGKELADIINQWLKGESYDSGNG